MSELRYCRFRKAQEIWAEHLGIEDSEPHDGSSPIRRFNRRIS